MSQRADASRQILAASLIANLTDAAAPSRGDPARRWCERGLRRVAKGVAARRQRVKRRCSDGTAGVRAVIFDSAIFPE